MNLEDYKNMNLHIDLSRGKPSNEQLDICMDMLNSKEYLTKEGIDCRNYGTIEGIAEVKELFSEIFGCNENEVFIGGNSTLNLMYEILSLGMIKGFSNNLIPLINVKNRKFLCPCPGYDRHFKMAEYLGFELIQIKMYENGPDIDTIEKIVMNDESVKGIFCVPLYSNPDGYVYSDEVISRLAKLKPKAADFKIFWDNAYMLHHFTNNEVAILNLLEEAKKYNNEDMIYMFFSTSKITFPGAGVAAVASSERNIKYLSDNFTASRICYDRLNQLRHINFLKNVENIKIIMKEHSKLIKPKFDIAFKIFNDNFGENNNAFKWTKPNGGYFMSLYVKPGYAKRIVESCKHIGVILTPAGSAFPYGVDNLDSHIRFAPTYASLAEVEIACKVICLVLKELV